MTIYNNAEVKTDEVMKQQWINALSINSGYTVIDTDIIQKDGFCPIDLIAFKNDKKILIELKDRCKPSTKYNDNLISYDKYIRIKKIMKDDNTITDAYVISHFNDNKIFINKIDDTYYEHYNLANKTTMFNETNKVMKHNITYKPRWIYTNDYLTIVN